MVDTLNNSLNVAIVGWGEIAKARHLISMQKEGAVPICIIEIKDIGSIIDGIPVYKSLEEAKEAGIKIDAVSICTPPNTHALIAKDALEQGYHVLLEKPPVLNLCELEELEEIAKEKGKTLFLAYHTASSPAVYKLQEILKDKKVIQIEANFFEEVTMWYNPDEWIFNKSISGGGITMDIGINAFSAICRTMPKANFTLIDCALVSEQNYPVDTKASIVFEDSVSGTKGTINLNWLNGRENKDIRRIKYSTDTGTYILDLSTARLYEDIEGEEKEIETDRDQEYEKVYEEFIKAIQEGKSYVPREEITFINSVYKLDEEKKNPEGSLPTI